MTDALIDGLSAPFELWQHEYRKQGRGDDITGYLTYVGIEHAIARFNEVLGSRWSWTVIDYRLAGAPDKPAAIVHGRISFVDEHGKEHHRDGLGAAQWQSAADDLDKIIKTAMADAFKKASHQFGMAGYLWDKGLADQVAVELLREEGRPWAAKYRPKQPRKGNPAAAILREVGKPQAQQAAAPAPEQSAPPAEAQRPVTHDGDPAWQKAYQGLQEWVKKVQPNAGSGEWAKTIGNLTKKKYGCTPRHVSGVDLAAFVKELQQGAANAG